MPLSCLTDSAFRNTLSLPTFNYEALLAPLASVLLCGEVGKKYVTSA